MKLESGETLSTQAVAPDGSWLFGESATRSTRGAVMIDTKDPRRVSVMQFPDVNHSLSGAATDGRWIVFSVSDGLTLDSAWTMYAWDSVQRGQPRKLGASSHPGPFPFPAVAAGKAFWTRAIDDSHSELHMANLTTGGDRIIRSGIPGYPFLYGSLVMWLEIAPGADNITLVGAASDSGNLVAIPAPLPSQLVRPSFVDGDQDTFVWSTDNLKSLTVVKAGDAKPVTIVSGASSSQNIQWPHVTGDLVTWDDGSANFVADLRTKSYAQLTPEFGGVTAGKDALVVSYAPASKVNGVTSIPPAVVRPSALPPLPKCSDTSSPSVGSSLG